jgi:hypothetical protein
MTYRAAVTSLLDRYGMIQHGELIPMLIEYDVNLLKSRDIDELFSTIEDMITKGEIKCVQYTLPGSRRVKSILFHRNAELYTYDKVVNPIFEKLRSKQGNC